VNAIEALGLNDATIVAHYTNARMNFLGLHHIFFTPYNTPGETFRMTPPPLFSAFVFERRRKPGGWDQLPWLISARKRQIVC